MLAAERSGGATPSSLVRQSLTRIAARESDVQAWAWLDESCALAQADALEQTPWRGPLYGVPIGVKDVIATRDMPTQYNCDLYAGHAPPLDAASVTLLRHAGAVILGKTHTVELASIGRTAPTRNPHALGHTPGGSSSGSAAAVADGHVPIALGTQTGGSIIRPASFCGIWALKPTWGAVSSEGMKPFAPSLDTLGWFGASVDDLILMLEVLAPDLALPASAPEPVRSVAVWRTAGWDRAGDATREAMALMTARLEHAGIAAQDLELPPRSEGLAQAQLIIMFAEGRRSFLAEYRRDPAGLHPRIRAMVEDGGGFTADEVRAAYDLAQECRTAFDRAAADHDAVLCPSTLGEAPAGLDGTGDLIFNGLLTLLHVPCVNLPLFTARSGLPVGLTLTGPRWSDRRMLEIARTFGALPDHAPGS